MELPGQWCGYQGLQLSRRIMGKDLAIKVSSLLWNIRCLYVSDGVLMCGILWVIRHAVDDMH